MAKDTDGMPERERLDLDAIEANLLRDVEEASRRVQQRQAKDRLAEKKAAEGSSDKTLMYTIIIFATLVIFAFAYWKTFMAGGPQNQPVNQPRVHVQPPPVQAQPRPQPQQSSAPVYRPMPQYGVQRQPPPTYRPPRVITPVQPSQPVPSEQQDEGLDQGM